MLPDRSIAIPLGSISRVNGPLIVLVGPMLWLAPAMYSVTLLMLVFRLVT